MKVLYFALLAFLISNEIKATVVKKGLSSVGSCIRNKEQKIFNVFQELIAVKYHHNLEKLHAQKISIPDGVQLDYDLQCSCFYVLAGEHAKYAQTGQIDDNLCDRAFTLLSKTPRESLDRAYGLVAEQIIHHERPWNSNWAARHEFLRTRSKI